jgi:monoamine oxidase
MEEKTPKVVIVGAGIGGLSAGLFLKILFPIWDIKIIEGMKRVGGRIYTANYKGTSYESGAGRIGLNHKYTNILLRRYGLDKKIIPITNKVEVITIPPLKYKESAIEVVKRLKKELEKMGEKGKEIGETKTLEKAVDGIYGREVGDVIRYGFEYDSESRVARCSVAIKAILETFHGRGSKFGVLVGGLAQLSDNIAREFKRVGGEIVLDHRVMGVKREGDKYRIEIVKHPDGKCGGIKKGIKKNIEEEKADIVIITTNMKTIEEIVRPLLTKSKYERYYGEGVLAGEPLIRVYAKFGIKRGEKVWFSGIGKTTTNKSIRYFIPVNEETGVAMISYTDSDYAREWRKIVEKEGEEVATDKIIGELRELFPEKKEEIKKPEWVKYEMWGLGAHYWRPGSTPIYGEIETERMLPMGDNSRLYVGGEAISPDYQAWIEGGIERSVKIVEDIYKKYSSPRV